VRRIGKRHRLRMKQVEQLMELFVFQSEQSHSACTKDFIWHQHMASCGCGTQNWLAWKILQLTTGEQLEKSWDGLLTRARTALKAAGLLSCL